MFSVAMIAMFVFGGCASAVEEVEGVDAGEPMEAIVEVLPIGEGNEVEGVTEEELVIEVSGKNFEFSEKEIVVVAGTKVKIVFTVEEGFHDWVIDEFGVATEQMSAGGTSEVSFVADKVGEYEYYCSVGNHRAMGMVGRLIVE